MMEDVLLGAREYAGATGYPERDMGREEPWEEMDSAVRGCEAWLLWLDIEEW
jgi:hypothetical protein